MNGEAVILGRRRHCRRRNQKIEVTPDMEISHLRNFTAWRRTKLSKQEIRSRIGALGKKKINPNKPRMFLFPSSFPLARADYWAG